MFGRAAIRLGIGTHSTYYYYYCGGCVLGSATVVRSGPSVCYPMFPSSVSSAMYYVSLAAMKEFQLPFEAFSVAWASAKGLPPSVANFEQSDSSFWEI